MLSLSPAKLLVILVIALIVLGPEKLPQMARQIGAAWHDLRQWRARIETEVRGTFPNLPPTHEVAQAVRSPLAFLDRLADEHERALTDEPGADAGAAPDADAPPADGTPLASGNGTVPANGTVPSNGTVPANGTGPSNGTGEQRGAVAHNGAGAGAPRPDAGAERAGTVVPGAFPAVPDDPSMN
ncbi:MAG TPA: twin-arginine translocase TatA/TatE family subunit [Acidimicrobiales bacterium]